ncbi:hypothetical protein FO519_010161, partial [Halicephalobus sp. NKZ332]
GTLQSITKDGSRTELHCVGIFTFKKEHESIVISVRSEDNSISENPHDKRELTTETLTGRYRARYDECTETMFAIRRPGQTHDRIKIHFENNQDLKKFEDCANKIIGKRPPQNTSTTSNTVTNPGIPQEYPKSATSPDASRLIHHTESQYVGNTPSSTLSTNKANDYTANPQIAVNVDESFPSDSPHNYPSEGTSHRRTEATPAVPRENPPPIPLHNPPVSLQAKIPPVTPQQTLSSDGDTPPQLPLKPSTRSPNSPQQHTPPVQRIPQQQSIQEIENQEANPLSGPGQSSMGFTDEIQRRARERAKRELLNNRVLRRLRIKKLILHRVLDSLQ